MGGHQQPPEPAGYSTQIGGDYSSGYHTTGYKKIIIDPKTLEQSIETFHKGLHGQSTNELKQTLHEAVIDSSAFGLIPNADAAYNELKRFLDDHADAMSAMGVSLSEFVARVQAAANLGYEADPVTRQRAAYARAHQQRLPE